MGVVLSGSEQLSLPENPWTMLEEPEIRRLLQMAGVGQWAAAQESAEVPSPLKEEFMQRREPGPQGWELGQYQSVQLLAALGDELGKRLLERLKENRLDNQARNKNWLIHGQQHVSRTNCEEFRRGVLEALDISGDQIPAWPDFRP